MKPTGILLAVKDMQAAKNFYTELLGLEITMNINDMNVTFNNSFSLQTLPTWADFIDMPPSKIQFGGNSAELVFEVEDLDEFMGRLAQWPAVQQVHPVKQYPWGQRVIRLYDPDSHVVEVGESMKVVVKRFLQQGLTVQQTVQASMYPEEFVLLCQQELEQGNKL